MHALPSKLGFTTLLLVVAACNAPAEAPEEEALDVTVAGDDGLLTFEIHSEEPVAEGHNDLHVVVLYGGTPFTESSISATVRMASMTHGGSAPNISDLGDGEFLFHDVTLDMPGQWQISMYAENTAQLKIRDTAVLMLEVP
jgi:hypothetical protein